MYYCDFVRATPIIMECGILISVYIPIMYYAFIIFYNNIITTAFYMYHRRGNIGITLKLAIW